MERLEVMILGKELTLACEPSEREHLLAAVKQVDELTTKIRESAGVMTPERIAVMACIQLASQLLSAKSAEGPFQGVAYGDYKAKYDRVSQLLDEVSAQLA